MRKQTSKTATAPPIRVGLMGLDPMRVLGLQEMFRNNPAVQLVHAEAHTLLRDRGLGVFLVGAPTPSALLSLLAAIRSLRADARVLVLSTATGEGPVLQMLAAGAKGHLADEATAQELQQAIAVVASGSIWAPRRVLSRLLEQKGQTPTPTAPAHGISFTRREREVLELLVAGRSNKEISKVLAIEENTVKVHVGRLMRKAGVRGRTALTMYVMGHSLLGAP